MAEESGCLFCRIINRKIPADIVTEEDELLAFRDINPQAPVHLLIIPTQHIPRLSDITEANAHLLSKALLLANRLAHENNLFENGYRIVINNGREAGQSVFHLHLHLLGGRPMRWPPG